VKHLLIVSSLIFVASSGAAHAEDVADNVKKSAKEASEAADDAVSEVREEIKGEPEDDDGELVKGLKTNTGRGYGPAGCGLGSILFEPNSGFTQVFAATTNGSLGTQTFGITSGTSNCAPGSGAASAKAFVETNRVQLAEDAARGSGETLDSLAKVAGCKSAPAVGASLQRRFDEIFTRADLSDAEVGERVVRALRVETSLGCGQLI